MTRDEAISKHRKMWDWISKHLGKSEEDYLEKFDPEAELYGYCYLCEYTKKHYGEGCENCQFECSRVLCSFDGIYTTWCRMMGDRDYVRAAELAKKIAELPEREETKNG